MQRAWARHERVHGDHGLESPHHKSVFKLVWVLRPCLGLTRRFALPEHAHAVMLKLGTNRPASHRVVALPQMGKQRRGGGGDGERARKAGGPQ